MSNSGNNTKIIRDQASLLSELSNISGTFDPKKNEGQSMFPSIIAWMKKSDIIEQEIEPSRLGEVGSLLFELGFTKEKDGHLREPSNWLALNDNNQAGGISENEDEDDNNPLQDSHKVLPMPPSQPQKNILADPKPQQTLRKRKRVRKGKKKTKGFMKNQTKNIPKNFGKAMISFIERNANLLRRYAEQEGKPWEQLISELNQQKKKINTIADLRRLWTQFPESKMIRVFSNLFLRKYGFQYVFHSRVSNITVHLKYRRRLVEAIKNPQQFVHIKEY